jgi:hypothetical protein
MARAPTINTPEIPQGPALPYQHLDIPQGAYGGQLATELQSTVDAAIKGFSQYQALQNESVANDANTALRTGLIEAWTDYNKLEGQQAVDGLKDYQQRVKSLYSSALGGLNSQQRRMAKPSLDTAYASALENGLLYGARQTKVWNNQSRDSAISLIGQEAVMHRTDPDAVNDAIDKAAGEVRLKGQNNGWAPDMVDAQILATNGKILGQTISVLANENPMQAQALFDRFQNYMDPVTRANVGEALKPKVLSMRADAKVADAMQPPPANFDELWGRFKMLESGGQQFDKTGAPLVSQPQYGADGHMIAQGGAVGISQMTPDTAKATAAAHGIDWSDQKFRADAAYNERLGQLHLQDLIAQYGGNNMLAASAYNAGAGATDSWITKFGDPRTGEISNADFAAKIPYEATRKYLAALGFDRDPTGAPDRAMVARVSDATKGDPELWRIAVPRAQAMLSSYEMQTAQDRADYMRAYTDDMAWISKGNPSTDPAKFNEPRMTAMFGPERGREMWDKYRTAQDTGEVYRIAATASPPEFRSYVDNLRARVETSPADAAEKQRLLVVADEAWKKRTEALKDDPAQFVQTNLPQVRGAWDRYAETRDVGDLKAAASATIDAQRRYGLADTELKPFTNLAMANIYRAYSNTQDIGGKLMALMPIVQAGDDTTVRAGIKQFVSLAKLPAEAQWAFEAMRRNDPVGASRILSALIAPPTKLDAATQKSVLSAVQGAFSDDYEIFAAQADLTKNPAYLSSRGNQVARLMARMVAGYGPDNQSTNAQMARNDVMGTQKPYYDTNIGPIFIPGDADSGRIGQGLDVLRAERIRSDKIYARISIPGQRDPVVQEVMNRSADQLRDEIRWVNIDDENHYAMVLPGGAMVSNSAGKIEVYTLDEAMTAGTGYRPGLLGRIGAAITPGNPLKGSKISAGVIDSDTTTPAGGQ